MSKLLDLGAVLRKGSFTLHDVRRAPAPGSFDPIGVMLHHTVSRRYNSRGELQVHPSLPVMRDFGNSVAPAPLGNILIDRALDVWLITDGRANDSGRGARAVLNRIKAGLPPVGDAKNLSLVQKLITTNGNRWFWDIELEHEGTENEPWDPDMIVVAAEVTALILDAAGYDENHALFHREWTQRKIDPAAHFGTGDEWRVAVGDHLDWLHFHPVAVDVAAHAPLLRYLPKHRPIGDIVEFVQRGGTNDLAVVSKTAGRGEQIPSMEVAHELARAGLVVGNPDQPIRLSAAAYDALPHAF